MESVLGPMAGILVAVLSFLLAARASSQTPPASQPGLALTFTAAEGKTAVIGSVSQVALYVEAGQPPTPFLPAGRFTAVWEGALNAELRSEYFFGAELSGELKLEINGNIALEVSSSGSASPLSSAIKLNKGPNSFKAMLVSPPNGNASLRLGWTETGTNTSPIPPAILTHTITPAMQKAVQLHRGRELFLEHRCIQCHADPSLKDGAPELKMDAPAFEGIGARRHFDWTARWILDPKALRPTTAMPKLLAGAKAKEEAEAIAAYLVSLKTGGEITFRQAALRTKQNTVAAGEGAVPSGDPKPLYERLHCAACHNPPGVTDPDPKKVPQQHVAEKFPLGKLAEFLRVPEAHYAWTRMPNFHLSAGEAKELEDWLFAAAGKPSLTAAPTDAALIDRGRKLVQTTGCLNCHTLKLENQFKAPALETLHSRHRKDRSKVPAGDCLGTTPYANYNFSAEDRAALEALTVTGFTSLSRHVPAEFAERQTRHLNCVGCHGQIDQVPPFDLLGGKLKPEWAAKFIAGEVPHKMRYDAHPRGEPWVEARMPAFKSRAAALATGLSALHGFPPKMPAEPPIDMELAKVGQTLVGKEGGFSCVSCHAVGSLLAMEVFESEGVNLAHAAERLQPSYYRRWMRSPLSIEPQTKMPTYFDEGKSPLADVLEGDAEKQIHAVWQYLRLGEKIPPPRTGEQ